MDIYSYGALWFQVVGIFVEIRSAAKSAIRQSVKGLGWSSHYRWNIPINLNCHYRLQNKHIVADVIEIADLKIGKKRVSFEIFTKRSTSLALNCCNGNSHGLFGLSHWLRF